MNAAATQAIIAGGAAAHSTNSAISAEKMSGTDGIVVGLALAVFFVVVVLIVVELLDDIRWRR